MIAIWQAASVAVFDFLLGWLLWLPRDAAVVLLGAFSAALAVCIRRWVCNRQLLGFIQQDKRLLSRLIRDARRAGDHAAVVRYRRVRNAVVRLHFVREIRALVAMAIPLVALITWASSRMDYLPPRDGEPIELIAWLPATAIGGTIHLVPSGGLNSADGWIRQIAESQRDGQTRGRAEWRIRVPTGNSSSRLALRFRERTLEQDVFAGDSLYAPPMQHHEDDIDTELRLPNYVPLGISAFARFGFPPWLIGYFISTLAVTMILSRLFPVAASRSR